MPGMVLGPPVLLKPPCLPPQGHRCDAHLHYEGRAVLLYVSAFYLCLPTQLCFLCQCKLWVLLAAPGFVTCVNNVLLSMHVAHMLQL